MPEEERDWTDAFTAVDIEAEEKDDTIGDAETTQEMKVPNFAYTPEEVAESGAHQAIVDRTRKKMEELGSTQYVLSLK